MMEKSNKVVGFLQLVELLVIVFGWAVQGSDGSVLQPPLASPPLTSAAIPPLTEGSKPSLPMHSPVASPPLTSATPPKAIERPLPSSPLHFPVASPPHNTPSPPLTILVQVPSLPPTTPETKAPPDKTPVPVPVALAPVQGVPRTRGFPDNSPAISPIVPRESPPPGKGVPPTSWFLGNSPASSPVVPGESHPTIPDRDVSPSSTPPTSTEPIPPVSRSPTKGSFSAVPPSTDNATRHSSVAPSPSNASPNSSSIGGHHSPASSPSAPDHKDSGPAPTSKHQDQVSPPTIAPKGRQGSNAPPPIPSAVPPTGRSMHYVPPPYPPAIPPTGRITHYAPPPFPSAVAPTGRATHYASPPLPSGVPPTSRHSLYVPPPFPSTVPPTSRASHNVPPPFPSEVPPTSRASHYASPPFLSGVPPTGRATDLAPPPFPSGVPPTSRPTHYAPPPFPSGVPPTGSSTHYAPPPSHHAPLPVPPTVPPTGRSTHHAPTPIPLAVPPTGIPSHYAPPPFLPTVSPKGMPRHYASPPFLPAVSPKGGPRRNGSPPFPPTVSPTAGPTHYTPPFLPAVPPRGRPGQYAPPPLDPGSSNTRSHDPFPPMSQVSPAPSPAPQSASDSTTTTFNPHLPQLSPSGSPSKSPKVSPPPPIMTLPPPPPNEDCSGTICTEPLTNTPPGSPCACVWPMQVGLSLGVDLFTFFPLVSELASEIAAGVFMKQSQVRIMGANAASQQPEKTVVLIDLVPMGEKFDNTTAFLTFQRFWLRKVDIKKSYFGDYEVLYVRYQGLPPSPPLPPSSIGMIDDGPYSGNNNSGRTIKPLGVDVQMKRHKKVLSGSLIAIIVLSAFVVVFLCSVAAWFLLLRHRGRASQQPPTPQASLPSLAKPSGAAGSMIGSVPSSASLSFGSSIVTYTGSAKTYSITDIERATNNFDESRVLGEGGFGRVYSADLDDGTKAAVKVLKRDDQQGGREFLAEVEMLSRLHHRNLVKLIGICTDERARCLVYELVPNGSVESHLHGDDKESAPLDWASRMKIALGAARGLAYLHEDSSPRVIHRDFKSSNILLEHDFTPKVSDFGLARTALDEESRHISTRVMGTFGYVAPEYAMTGHLLVKSDVYSYGVVLLELLTGRKPVDMSQPPGQENLVSYARPLLTSKEGLQILTDSSLSPDVPHDSVAKVAAIASMCVQPEVSHRPFMGEVVQALKLICNECDEANKEMGSRTSSHENLSVHCSRTSTPVHGPDTVYDSGFDPERGMPVFGGGSLRESRSGPLTTGRGWRFWRRMEGGVAGGSGGAMFRSRSGSY